MRSAARSVAHVYGVAYGVFPLGFDGITIAVNLQNTWVTCLTVDQLRAL
jgi:ABC-type phosphate transport system substrate-binding protein